MKNKYIILSIVLIALAILLYYSKNNSTSKETNTDYLSATEDIDSNDNTIRTIANTLKGRDDMETTKNTLRYVYDNIDYDPAVTTSYCFSEKASTVLEAKKGDCVSMTRLVSALLRANNIETRSIGGCLLRTTPCSVIQGIIPQDQIPSSYLLDNKKRGFLHEWVEVKINGKWYQAEPTGGIIYTDQCNNYLAFGYDTSSYNRCVITDNSFVSECRRS